MSGNLRVSRLEESHEHIIQDYEGGVIKRRELMKTNRGVELSERSSNPATDIFESKLELETMLAKMERKSWGIGCTNCSHPKARSHFTSSRTQQSCSMVGVPWKVIVGTRNLVTTLWWQHAMECGEWGYRNPDIRLIHLSQFTEWLTAGDQSPIRENARVLEMQHFLR